MEEATQVWKVWKVWGPTFTFLGSQSLLSQVQSGHKNIQDETYFLTVPSFITGQLEALSFYYMYEF